MLALKQQKQYRSNLHTGNPFEVDLNVLYIVIPTQFPSFEDLNLNGIYEDAHFILVRV